MKKIVLIVTICITFLNIKSSDSSFMLKVNKSLALRETNFTIVVNGDVSSIRGKMANDKDFFEKICNINDNDCIETDGEALWMDIESWRVDWKHCENRWLAEFSINYHETKDQSEDNIRNIKEFLSGTDYEKMTQEEKVKLIYNHVLETFEYDYDDMNRNINKGVKSKKLICSGYSSYFFLACQQAEIPCHIVCSDNHAWNIVKIGNMWYNVDTTWGDTTKINKNYCLIGKKSILDSSHKLNSLYNIYNHTISEENYKNVHN